MHGVDDGGRHEEGTSPAQRHEVLKGRIMYKLVSQVAVVGILLVVGIFVLSAELMVDEAENFSSSVHEPEDATREE